MIIWLPHHASCAPNISGGPIASPKQHLQTPVLSGLNILREVMVHPAGIPKVSYFNPHVTHLMNRVREVVNGFVVRAGGHSSHPSTAAAAAASVATTTTSTVATIEVGEVGANFLSV